MRIARHMVYLDPPDEDGEKWPQVRCPYLPDSTECGLLEENMDHEPDACESYDEGEDGCGDHAGWTPTTGCAVREVAANAGLAADELFAESVDIASLPRGRWFEVNVKWDQYDIEDARPVLTPVGGEG